MTDGPTRPHFHLFAGVRLVSLLTLASRVLGLLRDVGMAAVFGNGAVLDAFTVAFRIPNLARRLFGEGALSTALIPVFLREAEEGGRERAWKVASSVVTVVAVLLGLVVILGETALWATARLIPCGPEARLLMGLAAVMLPYLLLICAAAQFGAVLQAMGHFTWPALLPIILNVGWIAAIWFVTPLFATSEGKVYALAAAIVVLGLIQIAAPWPTLRQFGFRYHLDWTNTREQVGEVLRTMLPIVLGLSITQLNTLCDSLIAWGFSAPEIATGPAGSSPWPLEPGTASALYFAQRLYQFPLGVFGVALGTVLFPLLSQHAARGQMDRLREDLSLGLRLVWVVGLPASLGLVLLAEPITALLFRYGAFDAVDARQTSQMIAAYSIGVWAYCGLLIVHRGLYAAGDRITPVRVGTATVLLNLAMNLTLIWVIGGRALALSTALCAMVQLAGVSWCLQQRLGALAWSNVGGVFARAAAATAVMGAVCSMTLLSLPEGISFGIRLVRVGVPIAASVVSYGLVARFLGLEELAMLLRRDRAAD